MRYRGREKIECKRRHEAEMYKPRSYRVNRVGLFRFRSSSDYHIWVVILERRTTRKCLSSAEQT